MHRLCLSTVSVSACLALSVAFAAENKKAAPLYTNEDLARVSPLRDQTGAFSTPPAAPEAPPVRGRERAAGESYWRREAERLRQKLEPLRQNAEELRSRMEERERRSGVRSATDPHLRAWDRRLRLLDQRIRDLEERFEDRARREGALPGWLR